MLLGNSIKIYFEWCLVMTYIVVLIYNKLMNFTVVIRNLTYIYMPSAYIYIHRCIYIYIYVNIDF